MASNFPGADLGVRFTAYVDYYTPRMVPWFAVHERLWCNTKRHFSVFQHHPGARFIPWGTDLELFYPKPHESSDDLISFIPLAWGEALFSRH